jgi:hypothetical protein
VITSINSIYLLSISIDDKDQTAVSVFSVFQLALSVFCGFAIFWTLLPAKFTNEIYTKFSFLKFLADLDVYCV